MSSQKLFILRKFVIAKNIHDALKKDKITQVDEIWLDEDWKKERNHKADSSTGFLSLKKIK